MSELHEVTIDTRLVRTDTALSAEIGEEVVLLLPERNAYYDTNAHGAVIWRALNSPTTVRAICAWLLERYDVDADQCERDVLEFVRQAHREGLVRAASVEA